MSSEDKESVPTVAPVEAPVKTIDNTSSVTAPSVDSSAVKVEEPSVSVVEGGKVESGAAVPAKDSNIAPKPETVSPADANVSTPITEKSKPVEASEPAKEPEAVVPAAEKKEAELHGPSGFLAKLGKSFNPKSVNKRTSSTGAVLTKSPPEKAPEVPSKVEEPNGASVQSSHPTPVVVSEPAKPIVSEEFKGGNVEFKSHGGLFGGGWKQRYVHFGQNPYSEAQLSIFLGVHKFIGFAGLAEKDKQELVWNNLAHAEQTGGGLLIVSKAKQVDLPLNIVNMADVEEVKQVGTEFIVRTTKGAIYEFRTIRASDASKWTEAIKSKIEPSKAMQSNLIKSEGYKTALEKYKTPRSGAVPAKTPEAVTSDEEAGEASGKTKSTWKRSSAALLGAFKNPEPAKKDTTTATEALPTAKEETVEPVPAASALESKAPVASVPAPTSETTSPETSVLVESPTSEASKNDKRRSFATFSLGKKKDDAKPKTSTSADETTIVEGETLEAPVAAEATPKDAGAPAVDETAPTPVAEPGVTPGKEKRRTSLFAGFGSKNPKVAKDKALPAAPLSNAESSESAAVEPKSTSEQIVEPANQEQVSKELASETKPVETSASSASTPKREGLGRKLTERFKTLRSKSPSGTKPAKVSDEAPKIDTPIEEISGGSETGERVPATSTIRQAPLTTTEAKPVEETQQPEHKSAQVVSAQA